MPRSIDVRLDAADALRGAPAAHDLPGTSPAGTPPYAWYVAALICLAQVIALMDRYLLSVVLEAVKQDLALSDAQLGLLQGPSFVILFVAASLPLGRLADIGNSRHIIAGALLFWSLATFACGLSRSFEELLAARMAVGLGEAALLPAAMALINGWFSRDNLGRGLSIYTMGGSLGRVAGFVGGGAALGILTARGGLHLPWLGTLQPWHGVFVLAGGLGIGGALLFWATVREPPSRATRPARTGTGAGMGAGLAFIWRHRRAYLAVFVPFGMCAAITQQVASWTISFYVREHHLGIAAASALIGTTSLACGPAGHLIGGWLGDRLRARGIEGGEPLALAAILAIGTLLVALFCISPSVPVAAIFFGLSYLVISAAGPLGYGGAQLPTPDQYRGVVSSIFLICFTILGTGLGPLLVALVSDYGFRSEAMLGPAIIVTTIGFAAVGIPFALAGRRAFAHAIQDRAA